MINCHFSEEDRIRDPPQPSLRGREHEIRDPPQPSLRGREPYLGIVEDTGTPTTCISLSKDSK